MTFPCPFAPGLMASSLLSVSIYFGFYYLQFIQLSPAIMQPILPLETEDACWIVNARQDNYVF